MSGNIPGAISRGCDATYRGNLADKPRLVEKGEKVFAAGRIGVNMAAPDVPPEDRDSLTEWVEVIAFSKAMRARLLACEKGELVAVMGNVTKRRYQRRNGETAESRTVIADYMRPCGPSAAAAGGGSIPGAIPRGCDATYRGNLADKPRLVEKGEKVFAAGCIGVNMAAPDVPPEDRDSLTEWVEVIAFSEAMRARLLACEKGELISVSGNVTKRRYQRRNGETAESRTTIADYTRACGPSAAAGAGRKTSDMETEPAPDPHQPPQ